MSTATFASEPVKPAPSKLPAVVDAVRRAAHASHEVKLLESLAADAAEDAVYAARRTANVLQRRAVDARDALVYRVKRRPVQSMLITFAAGLLCGVMVRRTCSSSAAPDKAERA
jgi:hypothetical protein